MRHEQLLESQQGQWSLLRDLITSYAARSPIRSVAVVGNAPLLPDPVRAQRIDSADLVLRANALMLDEPGSEPCVGTVCHVALVSRSTLLTPYALRDYRDRLYLVPQAGFVQYQLDDEVGLLLHTSFWPSDLGVVPLPNGVVKQRAASALDPDHKPGSLIPTTGMMALFLAHEMFPDADLAASGLSFVDNRSQTHWSHHSGGHTKVNWQHRIDLEGQLVQSWIDDGSLTFYR